MISESDFEIAVSENFIAGNKLGSGKDGEVIEYTNKLNGAKFALKCITLSNRPINTEFELDMIKNQIELFKKQTIKFILNPHPNIVRVLYFFISDDSTKFYIFMEKMKSTLKSAIKERISIIYNYYTLNEYRGIICSLIKTFSYLEYLKIAHRDIKPDNIMFSEDGTIKIVDLGESNLGSDVRESFIIEIQGTVSYLAPELKEMYEGDLSVSRYATNVFKCDVFSLGIVFLQIGCLKTTAEINGINRRENHQRLLEVLLEDIENRYGNLYKMLLEKMLEFIPTKRLSFNELEQWIQGLFNENEGDNNINEEEEKKNSDFIYLKGRAGEVSDI